MHESFQKLTKHFGYHSSFNNHKSQLSLSTNSRNHIQTKACSGCSHNRRFTFQSPSSSSMKIRSNTGFIKKIDACANFFSFFFDFRKDLFFPSPDSIRILLVCTVQRPLTTKSQLPKQSADRTLTELNSELLFDYPSYHRASPQSKGELQLSRILIAYCFIYPCNLPSGKFSRSSAAFTGFQCMPTTSAIQRQPIVDTTTRESQCLDNYFWALSCLNTLDCSDAYLLKRLMIKFSSIKFFHTKEHSIRREKCLLKYARISNNT